MYHRLEIIAGRTGLDRDHIAWSMFRLNPCNHTPLTTTYSSRLPGPLSEAHSQIMQGWIEEGDIIGFVCAFVEE